ncbi:unnamed protein product [Acanthoscelides obtectus]|uniref:Nose resistant-to-fluoxetine protein N-terminal domain-containing protein n=2 Tax=Acanthoscelides obtectus TaxID=200917 RepID=A0A9P0MKI1_ACAOB|nr:unnamed protein product [Acanthoscelides obtectus]CAK1663252.1 Nose resistant to fluoxetine protein 6 [Acanthoscelides obtectus]
MRRALFFKVIFFTIFLQLGGESLQKEWKQTSSIQKIGAEVSAGLLDDFLDSLKNSSLSKDPCLLQLNLLVQGLEDSEIWALKMVDASAKFSSGILEGNIMFVGSYDECLKINSVDNLHNHTVKGKYCTTIVNNVEHQNKGELLDKDSMQDIRMTYGVCIPAACTEDVLNELAQYLTEILDIPFHFHFYEDLCDYKDKNQLSLATIISLSFFILMATVCILSTLYDALIFSKSDQKSTILIAFSFYTNGQKLISTRTSKNTVGCLNGLRVVSMMLTVLSHIYMYSMIQPLINLIDYAKDEEHSRQVVQCLGSLAVDTFFVTGGFLVSYNYLLKSTDEKSIPFCKFYIHRFLRLSPSLGVVVLFYATIFYHVGSGPFWTFINYFFIDYCKENWWSTLLYVQNYVHPNNMCIGQSWYLAVDTQMYLLAPFMLYLVIKKPRGTIALLILLIVASCGFTFGISLFKEVGPAIIGNTNKVMKYIYVTTYTRATPWLMGFILGFGLARSAGHIEESKQVLPYV